MRFADIPPASAIFLDANTLIYHFIADSLFGNSCTDLLDRIERREVTGYTSSAVLAEMTHRLMTEEACGLLGWPAQGIANRLKRHPAEVQRLVRYRNAIDEVSLIGLQVLPVTGRLVSLAADDCSQFGLLTNDGLIVAVMRDHNLSLLASNDADFDRVSTLTRYAPA